MTAYQFRTEPMDHQKRALRSLVRTNGRQLLTLDAGLGKTKVVLDYCSMLALKLGRCSVFVAGPLSAVDTWADEAAKHVPEDIDVRVVTVDSGTVLEKAAVIKAEAEWVREFEARSDTRPTLHLVVVNLDVFSQGRRVKGTKTVTLRDKAMDAVRAVPFDVGVVDESHKIKGHGSKVSRAFLSMSRHFPRRIGLTGTVAPNSPMDFYGQMRWVNADVLGTRFADYEVMYCRFGGYEGREVIGYHNLDHLSAQLKPWVTVAKKEDALDLPPVTHARLVVDLSPRERDVYEEMKKEAMAKLDPTTRVIAPRAITKWMRLRQVTSGFIKDGETVHPLGDTKAAVAADKARTLVEQGEKVVVFAHFIHDVDAVAEALGKLKGVPVHTIIGATKADDRRTIRKKFLNHDGPMVVVAQQRTGIAINEFVAACHVIFISYSERYDDYLQAVARLDRKGQTRPVTVWHVVARDTLDEKMLDAYERKGSLEEAVLAEARRG